MDTGRIDDDRRYNEWTGGLYEWYFGGSEYAKRVGDRYDGEGEG